MVGRLALANSVTSTIQFYNMQVEKLPSGISKAIERRQKDFI